MVLNTQDPPFLPFQQSPLVEASGTQQGSWARSVQQGLHLQMRTPRPWPDVREAGVSVTDRLVRTQFALTSLPPTLPLNLSGFQIRAQRLFVLR